MIRRRTALITAAAPPQPAGSRMQAIAFALLCAAFLYQMGWAWFAAVPRIVGNITNDDTFLYLEFARNTVAFGFPTFDGIHATNGVQPLWAMILVLTASLVQDKVLLLRVVLALCAILNAGAGFMLIKTARQLGSRIAVPVVGLCWSCYMIGLSPSMLGMENSLHAFVAAGVLLYMARLWMSSQQPSGRQYLLLGILLAVNVGVRLDSAVISLVLGVVAVRRDLAGGNMMRRVLLPVFGPMLLAAVTFCLANYAYFGAALPVSGMAKSFYADRYLDGSPPWLWLIYVAGAVGKVLLDAPQWLLAEFAPESVESIIAGVVLILVAIPLLLRIVGSRLAGRPSPESRLAAVSRILAIAVFAHMAVLSVSILHFSVEPWYHSWLLISWMVWISWALERWLRSAVLPPHVARVLPAALLCLVVLCMGLSVVRQMTGSRSEVDELHVARLGLSEWINTNLPADAKLGAWNAGILAYFTDRTLVNLDGLMNSPEYVRSIVSGGAIGDIIAGLTVDVIVDYNNKDSTMPRSQRWDRKESFRGVWKWQDVIVLQRRHTGDGRDLYVLKLDPVSRKTGVRS